MSRPRAADDFAAIRVCMEELRREREAAPATEGELQSDRPIRPNRNADWWQREISGGPGRVRQSGPIRSYVETGVVDFSVSQSRRILALSWSRAFSAGSSLAILVSVSASMDRNATASGRRGRPDRQSAFLVHSYHCPPRRERRQQKGQSHCQCVGYFTFNTYLVPLRMIWGHERLRDLRVRGPPEHRARCVPNDRISGIESRRQHPGSRLSWVRKPRPLLILSCRGR